MRKMVLTMPDLKTILKEQADDFPVGFMWPWTVLIREAWTRYGDDLRKAPIEFTIPQYGVLTFHGREYTFVPSKAYRTTKGYADEISGRWG